jgi:hypothetical protein
LPGAVVKVQSNLSYFEYLLKHRDKKAFSSIIIVSGKPVVYTAAATPAEFGLKRLWLWILYHKDGQVWRAV